MLQTDWGGKPYHSLDYELKKQFGKKIYKISLDGGMQHQCHQPGEKDRMHVQIREYMRQ